MPEGNPYSSVFKFTLLAFFLWQPLFIKAQEEEINLFDHLQQFIEIGMGTHDVYEMANNPKTFPNRAIGLQVGLFTNFIPDLSENIKISLGMKFQVSGNVKRNVPNGARINSIVLPLEFKYSLVKNEKRSFYLIGGGSLNYLDNISESINAPDYDLQFRTTYARIGFGTILLTHKNTQYGFECRYIRSAKIDRYPGPKRDPIPYQHHGLELSLIMSLYRGNKLNYTPKPSG